MADYVSLAVQNNKFPCTGPRVIPVSLDFSTASSLTINLQQLTQRGLIEDVQGFFIDNSANSAALTLTISTQQQKIVIPPNSQAYINALLSQPIFTAATTPATGLSVSVYALNFPVTNAVWNAAVASSATSNVNIAEVGGTAVTTVPVNLDTVGGDGFFLGPQVSAGSISVTPATDASFGSSSITYLSNTAGQANVTATTTAAYTALTTAHGNAIRIVNLDNTNTVFVTPAATSTVYPATTTSLAVPPGKEIIVSLEYIDALGGVNTVNGISLITSTGTANVQMAVIKV